MVATLQVAGELVELEACDTFTKIEDDDTRVLVCRFVVEPENITQELLSFLVAPQGTNFVVTSAGLEHHITPFKSVIQAQEMRQENPQTLEMTEGAELQFALETEFADAEYRLA